MRSLCREQCADEALNPQVIKGQCGHTKPNSAPSLKKLLKMKRSRILAREPWLSRFMTLCGKGQITVGTVGRKRKTMKKRIKKAGWSAELTQDFLKVLKNAYTIDLWRETSWLKLRNSTEPAMKDCSSSPSTRLSRLKPSKPGPGKKEWKKVSWPQYSKWF